MNYFGIGVDIILDSKFAPFFITGLLLYSFNASNKKIYLLALLPIFYWDIKLISIRAYEDFFATKLTAYIASALFQSL